MWKILNFQRIILDFFFFAIRETARFLFIILNAPVHKFSSLLTSYTVTIDRIHTVNGG